MEPSNERNVDPGENGPNRWHTSYESLVDPKETKWKDLSFLGKLARILFILLKIMLIFATICVFILSLALLSDSLTLVGGGGTEMSLTNSTFLNNPVSASIAGIAISSILLSGNALMSLLVGMIASGLLTVHQAIPIMLGTEIGASLTNALISLTQSGNRDQFRRAFAAVTVNDIFNILLYIIVLPVELATGIIETTSGWLVYPLKGAKTGEFKTLSFLTDPVLNYIIQIDDEAIDQAKMYSRGNNGDDSNNPDTYILRCVDINTEKTNDSCPYNHIFAYSTWSDTVIGVILLLISLVLLLICLLGIVKLTQMLLKGHLGILVRKLMDKSLPWPFGWLTDYLIMVVGCLSCMLIQSSDVFRTVLTPLVGIGVVTLEKLYPLLLGGNVGTTFTGVLASLSSDPDAIDKTLQISLAQTTYNIIGILLFYPIPFMRSIPLGLAKKLGNITAKYRWFSLVYIAVFFYIGPGILFGLSFIPLPIMLPVIIGIILFVAIIIVINVLQVNHSKFLPKRLRNWDFLPIWLHSLTPYDKVIDKYWKKLVKKEDTPKETSLLRSRDSTTAQ